MKRKPARKSRRPPGHRGISKASLEAMIEGATVDAYGESEELVAFYTAIEDHLAVPFETTVLGASATVKRVDLREPDQIVAICVHGRERQAIGILDLPLPSPPPAGAEWIEAYRHWARGR